MDTLLEQPADNACVGSTVGECDAGKSSALLMFVFVVVVFTLPRVGAKMVQFDTVYKGKNFE